jgi:hypothetical protein
MLLCGAGLLSAACMGALGRGRVPGYGLGRKPRAGQKQRRKKKKRKKKPFLFFKGDFEWDFCTRN